MAARRNAVSSRWVFPFVGVLAILAGAGSWFAASPGPRIAPPAMAPDGILAAGFRSATGEPQSLAAYRGKTLVINFWAPWCAPCREEMPAFSRLQAAWSGRNVQFVGLTSDDPARVRRFLAQMPVSYPILVGPEADHWARILGDREGLLPFTVVLRREGTLADAHVGVYSAGALDQVLERASH